VVSVVCVIENLNVRSIRNSIASDIWESGSEETIMRSHFMQGMHS
jgi:hypothetical protein